MLKNITLIMTVLFLISCGQSEVDLSKISTRNGLAYQVNENSPFTGKVFSKLKNGQILISGNYKEGKKDGEWNEFFNNGQLKSIENYTNDILNGVYKSYKKDGNPILITNYKNGNYDENYKEYNTKNILVKDINYDNGNYNGTYKAYNTNGILIKSTNYKNGIIDGLHTNYYDNGAKKLEYTMSNNIYTNDYTEFNLDGVIKTHFNYSNGQKKSKGVWKKYWSSDWKIVNSPSKYYSTVTFDENGAISSKVKYFYQDTNKLQSEHTYKTLQPDFREGESLWYSQNGTVTMKGNYKNNKRNGTWETYYDSKNAIDTNLKESVNYSNGEMNGAYIFIANPNKVLRKSSALIPVDKDGSKLLNYIPQTDYGYWKLEGTVTNNKLDKTWKIWLLRSNKCYYKIDVYSTAIWNKGNEVKNSYMNLQNGYVYTKNGVRFTSFWGNYAKEQMKSLKPYKCLN